MINIIYQIQISLNGSKPRIWRRLLVSPDLLLSDFHKVIQTAMGWTNSHLHQFIKNRKFYTERRADDDYWYEMDNVDYSKMTISDLLKKEKEKILYEYDFGDAWEHNITLEKILPKDDKTKYPVCIGGKMNCPPEDCGGIWSYCDLLEILKQPKHEEYEDYMKWLGDDFDPNYFDKEEKTDLLRTDNFGMFGFF